MTANTYLNGILNKYHVNDITPHSYDISILHSRLKDWANSCYINIITSGSTAKGTAVSLSSDVDYLISLTSSCNNKLEEIFNSLHEMLDKHYTIRRQNVSFGINLNGLKIDVTAAKKRSGNTNNHSIFVSKVNSWKKTNIQKHINDISKSGRTNEIKIIKIWRELNSLEFPSIYIEYLLTQNILKNKSLKNLSGNVFHILTELSKNQGNPLYSRLVDPANSNNILSDILTEVEKKHIIAKAKSSIKEEQWGNIVY